MLKNVADITTEGKQTGLNTQDNVISIDKTQSPNMMNVIVNHDGTIEKRLGSNTQNAVIIANSAAAGFSPTGSITNNIVAYWKMDEVSGNRSDSIGGHTLTDNNSVPSDGGIKNKAASFVLANTQYLLHNNTSTLATGDVNFSMSAWFYLSSTSTTTERTIISKRDANSNPDIILLLHCDGSDASTTFTDNSLNSFVITASGNAQLDTAQQKFGTASGLFDGTGDYINIPDNAVWDFGTGDFTIEFWVRFSSIVGVKGFTQGNSSTDWINFYWNDGSASAQVNFMGGAALSFAWSPSADTWYHLAISRASGSVRVFVDGVQAGATQSDSTSITAAGSISIGRALDTTFMQGWIDDVRISNQAKYTANFAVPTAAFTNPTNPSQYEYWLFVNTDNILTFKVSSSGTAFNGTISASSFGALTTATWYHAIAYHDTANLIAVGVNLSMNSAAYTLGLLSGSAPFVVGAVSNGASNFFDGRIDEVGFWKKVLNTTDRANLYNSGSANTYSAAFDNKPWASFDFGASSIRWLTVSAGTGVYASSNLGLTWVNIATDRTATYQSFERSKNVLIATSDTYDTPLAWPGSSGTFMTIVNPSAPLCRYAINFQGFLILLNSSARKRGFFYQDENTQLTGAWSSSFDIPSSQDDEITSAFILRRYLYVSTRYYLYRVSYVGGNPDFSYLKVKDWGYVARTVRLIYVEGVGQVVAGLCWDGKMRLFDGSDDQIFSDNVENDNGICEFALDNLSFAGSGPVVSFAETDYNTNVYKLCVAIGEGSSQTTHMLNYDGRAKAFYPFNRQHFNTMVMAESGNMRFLMAFDRSGYCHMLDSGNLDGNTSPIDDYYDSSLIFEKSPAQIQKGHQTHLHFSNESCGRIYYMDRTDFDSAYSVRDSFNISGTENKFIIAKVIDIPESYQTYQFRITSSSGTNDPWKCQRYDHFLRGLGIGNGQ